MLKFQELRITQDSKYLIVDVAVQEGSYFKDVTIDSIVIDNQDTFSINGPSSNPIYVFDANNPLVYSGQSPVLTEDESFCYIEGNQGIKSVKLYLNKDDVGDLNENMFFVYAMAAGYPSPETPCGLDNIATMGTVVNLYPFYQNTIEYLKELCDDCNPPKNFLDSVLRFKAFELSIKTGNYLKAIEYWKKFFSKPGFKNHKHCKCHGRDNKHHNRGHRLLL